MASAGRILIIPKGAYDPTASYENLDLVFHGGTSWIAKKPVTGIEPAEINSEYWFKLCDSFDATEIYNRLAALETQMISTVSLDDIDLTPYAKEIDLASYALKTDLTSYALKTDLNSINSSLSSLDGRLDTAEPKVTNLTTDVNTLKSTVNSLLTSVAGLSGVKFSTGRLPGTEREKVTVPCTFPPKLILILGKPLTSGNLYSITVLIPDRSTGVTIADMGNGTIDFGALSVTKSGNNTIMEYTENANLSYNFACWHASMVYDYVCIG